MTDEVGVYETRDAIEIKKRVLETNTGNIGGTDIDAFESDEPFWAILLEDLLFTTNPLEPNVASARRLRHIDGESNVLEPVEDEFGIVGVTNRSMATSYTCGTVGIVIPVQGELSFHGDCDNIPSWSECI